MCAVIEYKNKTIETIGEFRKAFGEPIVDHRYYEYYEDNDCLCVIKIEKSLKASGFSFKRFGGGLLWEVEEHETIDDESGDL